MILRTRRTATGRRCKWLLAAVLLVTSAALPAQQAAAPLPPAALPPGRAPVAPPARDAPVPDEDLLEFLGSDDTGDVAWWEFLKRAPQRVKPVVPPPQDAKP